jgi:uncharacterized membrane protein
MSGDPNQVESKKPRSTPMKLLGRAVRSRIIGGVMVVSPLAITIFIIHWLYTTLQTIVIGPVARLFVWAISQDGAFGPDALPVWFQKWVAPLVAIVIVLVLLYMLGMFFRSRLHGAMDEIVLKVPFVTTIYKAVRNVFVALQQDPSDTARFKRVVLVKFPHPGMRVPGFVTSSCKDEVTGKIILCVYIPTTPVPTSGYMLLIPEDEVTDLPWDLNETLQAIISGGISVPSTVNYYPAASLEES